MQWPQVGLVYSGKKLLEIPINNEKMHNILRIYGVSHRTFNGHKHLRVLFGSCRNTRGCRTQVEMFFFSFSGLDADAAATDGRRHFPSLSLCGNGETPLVLHECTQDKLDGLHKWGIVRSHRHLQNTCTFTPECCRRSSSDCCRCDSWQILGESRISLIALLPSAEETRCTYSHCTCRASAKSSL